MPSKRQKNSGALLPAVLPDETVCLRMEIPNDELIIAAAVGKLADLGKWLTWERTGGNDTRATDLAQVFRQLLETTLQIGDCTMIDCDIVQACLNQQDPPPRKTETTQTEADLLAGLTLSGVCNEADKDVIFGFTTGIVELLDTALTDIFEKIELLTNVFEVINEILDSIPLIGGLASLYSDMIGFMQNTIGELYLASIDAEERDYIRCQLFCLAVRNNCRLTIADITEWLVGEIGNEIVGTSIDDFIEYFVSIGITAPKRLVVLSAFALVMWAINWGSEVVGVGNAARFVKVLAALNNDPDADWMFLCEDCGFCIEWDFTQDNYTDDWQPVYPLLTNSPSGLYAVSTGFVHQDVIEHNNGNGRARLVGLTCNVDFEAVGAEVQTIEVEYYWIYGQSAGTNAHSALADDGVALPPFSVLFSNRPSNGDVSRITNPNIEFKKLGVVVRSSLVGAPINEYSGSVTIKKITVRGVGNVPAHHGENC